MSFNILFFVFLSGMLILSLALIFLVIIHQKGVIRNQLALQKIRENQQRALLKASIEGEEKERERIAQELHDDVCATLATVNLYLYKAGNTEDKIPVITESKALVDDSIKKLRGISHRLQPTQIMSENLLTSLQNLCKKIDSSGAINCEFSSDHSEPALNIDTKLSIYRIAQEVFNNLMKHAHPSNVYFVSSSEDRFFTLNIFHDGNGLIQSDFDQYVYNSDAIGLKNMVSRATVIGAKLTHSRNDNGEYRIQLKVPL